MYQTKQISYNTKNLYTAVETNISQKRKNVTRIDCIKQLFESSNRKVFLSNAVILLTLLNIWTFHEVHVDWINFWKLMIILYVAQSPA